jgi:hypothetical protein
MSTLDQHRFHDLYVDIILELLPRKACGLALGMSFRSQFTLHPPQNAPNARHPHQLADGQQSLYHSRQVLNSDSKPAEILLALTGLSIALRYLVIVPGSPSFGNRYDQPKYRPS